MNTPERCPDCGQYAAPNCHRCPRTVVLARARRGTQRAWVAGLAFALVAPGVLLVVLVAALAL